MSDIEDQIENLMSKSSHKNSLLNKLCSRFKGPDLKLLEDKIDEIILNNENKKFDDLFDEVYYYVTKNIPSYVDEGFYEDVSKFVNENIKYDK
ncbi:hypothetical protein COBT_001386 [Conglomerata obtusa]